MSYILFLRELQAKPLKASQCMWFAPDRAALCLKHGLVSVTPGTTRRQGNTYALTDKGRDVLSGKLEFYVPYKTAYKHRAKGTERRLKATWLQALPQGISLNVFNVLL